MTTSTLTDLLLGLVLIAYISSRQFRWRPVDPAKMFKLPLILAVVGIVLMARQATTIHPVDVVILGVSAALAATSGLLMGGIARFRPSPSNPGQVESRTGWIGVAIWFGLIAVRIGLDVVGHRMGSVLATSTGTILVIVGLNRLVSALVVSARQPRHSYAMAGK